MRNKRRNSRRRALQPMMFVDLDLTADEIMADLDPGWAESASRKVSQDRKRRAA